MFFKQDLGVGGSCIGSASQTGVNRSAPAMQLPLAQGSMSGVGWG
ncbi:hypothetical protein [Desulfosporosinus sp. FKA]|nr:hypothetical protein [Desulfosporosinus sp. FKA]